MALIALTTEGSNWGEEMSRISCSETTVYTVNQILALEGAVVQRETSCGLPVAISKHFSQWQILFLARLCYDVLYKLKSYLHLEGMLLFSKACLFNILWKTIYFFSFNENSNQTFLKISIKSVGFFLQIWSQSIFTKKSPLSLLYFDQSSYMHSLITPYKVHYIGLICLLVSENIVRINITCTVD